MPYLVFKNVCLFNMNKRNDKRFSNRDYSLFIVMGIFLKHLWLILNIIKWQDCKIFTKLVLSQTPSRSSHRRCYVNFIKKRLPHMCFPVKFRNFLRTPILKNICERLLLSFLGFTKLNHNVFLWLSWRHRFLNNNVINC